MNKGTLISFFICLSTIGLVNPISAISVSNVSLDRHCTYPAKLEEQSRKEPGEANHSALQITFDQIVQHVSTLIEGRPNSKKNIVIHLAAIMSSIINFIAKMASCQNKQRDSFYHELNTKLQNVLTECALEEEDVIDVR